MIPPGALVEPKRAILLWRRLIKRNVRGQSPWSTRSSQDLDQASKHAMDAFIAISTQPMPTGSYVFALRADFMGWAFYNDAGEAMATIHHPVVDYE